MQANLDALNVPGATLATCFGVEGKPAYVNVVDASNLAALMKRYEVQHGITPASKRDLDMHMHHHKLLLKLMIDSGKAKDDNWVTAASLNMLWSGFNHPGLGERLRREASEMLRTVGRATMLFDTRQGALYFYVSSDPIPERAKALDDHVDPPAAA